LFAAFQVGTPVLALALSALVQGLFFAQVSNPWIVPAFAAGIGYLLPKRLLATAAHHRQKKLAIEIATFIPLLRILFESGMAVEQSLRVMSNDGKQLLPILTQRTAPDTGPRRLRPGTGRRTEQGHPHAGGGRIHRHLRDPATADSSGWRRDEIAAGAQAIAR
jgi:hypothetical protein